MQKLIYQPLLTADEEKNLARLAAKGDIEARDRMILSNERMVWKIARRYSNCGIDVEDLVQEGMIGLHDAVRGFDPERGFRFSTYAGDRIRQKIGKHVSVQSQSVRSTSQLYWKVRQYRRLMDQFQEDTGSFPTDEELQALLDVNPNVLANIRKAAAVGFEHQGSGISAISSEKRPDEVYEEKESLERVVDALRYLDERSRDVVKLRFGFGTNKVITLEEVGKRYKLTRERVRQIESEAIEKLRRHLDPQGLECLNFSR